MTEYQLHIRLFSFWHVGSGRGGGLTVDAVVHKDSGGLPELPGRTIKGLVRDAVSRAEAWGHLEAGTTETWFGSDGRNYRGHLEAGRRDDDPQRPDRYQTDDGLLVFDNGVLPAPVAAWLRQGDTGLRQDETDLHQDETDLRDGLYHHLYATAVDHLSGTASHETLRGTEVVVPLDLYAPISALPRPDLGAQAARWPELLPRCLPLIRGLGVSRTRGLGRCCFRLEVVS